MTREHIKTSMMELENITKEICKDAQFQTPKTMQNATLTQMQNSTCERREGNTTTPPRSLVSTNVEWEALRHLKHRLDINI